MKGLKKVNIKMKDIVPYEHLEFCVTKTTPYQRWLWLKRAWDLKEKKR